MLKKLMLLSCVSLLALVACGEEGGGPSTVESDSEESSEFGFSIEIISDEELTELEDYIEVNYAEVRDGFITEGLNLLFNFNHQVTDFSLIEVAFLEDGSFAKTGVLYEISEINPDRPLVITHYFGDGAVPTSGFYFAGPNHEGGWFTFEQSQFDGEMIWHPFHWSHHYDLFEVSDEMIEDELEIDSDSPDIDDVEGVTPELDPITQFEELVEVIVAAGTFWEDWWDLRGRFAPEHIEEETVPAHLVGFYSKLLPTSGFESLDDIRNYLLQYYTENWVNLELSRELPVFIEYDGILYIATARAGFPRPDWETATHILIEQNGSHAVVETVVLVGTWHAEPYGDVDLTEMQYHFIFINDQIDSGVGAVLYFEDE